MNTIRSPGFHRLALFAATAPLLLFGLSAQAAEPSNSGNAPTKIVAYGELDLTSPSGAAVLYRRLQSAARVVCASLESRDLSYLSSANRWHACYKGALASAVFKVNSPKVSAIYEGDLGARGG